MNGCKCGAMVATGGLNAVVGGRVLCASVVGPGRGPKGLKAGLTGA